MIRNGLGSRSRSFLNPDSIVPATPRSKAWSMLEIPLTLMVSNFCMIAKLCHGRVADS